MKHWNVGNTTVRNPDRIMAGLEVLSNHFEGILWDESAHERYYDLLVEAGVVEKSGRELAPDSKGIAGRKWAACFNQLGLAVAWKSKGAVVITESGKALLDGRVSQRDVFLRQFLKYHLPSPLEQGKDYAGFNTHPFRLTLRVINALRERGMKGITKEEISLYLITTLRNEEESNIIDSIEEYRKARDALVGSARKRVLYHEKKKALIVGLYGEELGQVHFLL